MVSIVLLIIIYLTFTCSGLQDPLLGSAWPSMYIDLNAPLHYAGYLTMIIYAGRVLSSIIGEKIIRRFGTGFVVLTGVLLLSLSLFGFSFSHFFIQLCVWAVPLSIGVGLVDLALNSYVALHYRAKFMVWLHCFWSTGASIAPIIISFYLINQNSWNSGYRTIGIIECCLAAVLIFSLPLWKKNKTNTEAEGKPKGIPYKEIFSVSGVKEILIVFLGYVAIQNTIVLWGSSFLVIEKNILPETAAGWISVYYIGLTLGRLLSGFITIKLNNRQIIRAAHAVIACGIITVLLPLDSVFLMAGFFILGFGCAPIYPCLVHETPKIFGNNKAPLIIGLEMACGNIGAIIMPPMFGRIASAVNFRIFPLFLAVFLIICIFTFELLYKKRINPR